MPWSQEQAQALAAYLARKPRPCPGCGAWDREGRGIVTPAPRPVSRGEPVDAGRNYVEAACRRCGREEAIDREDAGVPGRAG